MWLTAIGRAAARRGLLSSRTATRNFGARPALASVRRIDASQYLSLRSLSISAATRSPAKSSTGSKTTKKTKTSAPKKKKKAVAKKKPAKKPALKKAKKPKKAVTPEEKEKSELRQLRKMALLKGPQLLPESAWSVYMSDNMRAGQGSLSDKVKELSQSFANVSASEKDRLQSVAQTNQSTNKDTRQQWITSHPPEVIYLANVARRRIARKTNKSRIFLIHDSRLPKRSGSPYTLFIKSRFSQANSGSNGTAQDTFRAVSKEWRSLSESEKQSYRDEAAKEAAQSQAEFKELKEKAKAYVKAQKGSLSQVPS
ncbi:HMG box protein [Moelleriella libera RCEF 2490]|uniref:HMG box protein n=1 Tax=Moelleriella libera RCEF 2490 TaxID=1081109 RepID=A0A166RP01_9HYPO|nr:HMG box protein [Moelleriella libera RCEF 2490]